VKIIWCEQSGILEDRQPFISMLHDMDIGFRRLNWKHRESDPYANVYCDSGRVSWSKGREALFETVKDELQAGDYVVFADDDIEFVDGKDGLIALVDDLSTHTPQLAVPYSTNWHNTNTMVSLKRNRCGAFPIFAADLQVQIMRWDFAELVFPVIYDGGYGTLWYAYFFNAKLNGYGALCLPNCHIINTRHDVPDGDYGGDVNCKSNAIWAESGPILPFGVRIVQRLFRIPRMEVIRIFNSLYARLPYWMLIPDICGKSRIRKFRQSLAELSASRLDSPLS
jgi:hypothetical protein